MPRSPLSATGRACREGPPPPPCFPAARADARARPITEPPQRMLSERPAHRAGQDTDAAKPELVQALEHRIDETVAEDLLLELVGVDEHGRVQRIEGGRSKLIEDPRRGPTEICLAGAHVADQVDLRVAVPAVPVLVEPLEAQAPAGGPLDRLVERLQFVEVVLGVGHTEDLRLDGFLPAGPVGLVGVAAGQQAEREEEYEGYTGHGATVRVVPRADHGAVPASHIRALGSTWTR